MKKIIFFLFTVSITAWGYSQTVSDPNAVVRKLNNSFHAIKVSDGIELFLSQGSQEAIAVSAGKQEYFEKLKTEVENGVLKIYYDESWNNWNVKNRNLKAYVTCINLDELKASSGSEVNISGVVKSTNFSLQVSSGADFEGNLVVTNMQASSSSGSSIHLSGSAKTTRVKSSSGSDIKGLSFTTESCDADASSGSGIDISVSNDLTAEASSGGRIRYKGGADIKEIAKSRGGSVKKI